MGLLVEEWSHCADKEDSSTDDNDNSGYDSIFGGSSGSMVKTLLVLWSNVEIHLSQWAHASIGTVN